MTVPVELHRLQPLNCEMAMFENAFDRLPPIYITTRDRSRLRTLLEQRGRSIPDVVRASLERELARAIICSEDSVPPDVVTMNSRALFSTDLGAEPQSRTLIYDDGYSLLGGTVSITTALGAALLGLRAGSRMPYVNIDGERRVLGRRRPCGRTTSSLCPCGACHGNRPIGIRTIPDPTPPELHQANT
jgi:regulator of nucleoside diphosphate kinase